MCETSRTTRIPINLPSCITNFKHKNLAPTQNVCSQQCCRQYQQEKCLKLKESKISHYYTDCENMELFTGFRKAKAG